MDGGTFVIDLLMTFKGQRVALEIDGPSHFTANVANHPTGATVARHACLRALGLKLVVVPYFELMAVRRSPQQQRSGPPVDTAAAALAAAQQHDVMGQASSIGSSSHGSSNKQCSDGSRQSSGKAGAGGEGAAELRTPEQRYLLQLLEAAVKRDAAGEHSEAASRRGQRAAGGAAIAFSRARPKQLG